MRRDVIMSSGRKLLVAGMAVFAITISTWGDLVVCAQESSGPTLSERFSALGRAFKRGDSRSRQAAPRTTTGRPTYGSTARSRSTASNKSRTNTSSRSGLSSLLPNGLFGGSKKSTAGNNSQRQPSEAMEYLPPEPPPFIVDANVQPPAEVAPQTTVDARVGSASRSPNVQTRARKSPSSTRQEDLDETLTDLLKNEAVISDQPVEAADDAAKKSVADQPQPAAMPPSAKEPIFVARRIVAQRTVAKDDKKAEPAAEPQDAPTAVTTEIDSANDHKSPATESVAAESAADKPVATKSVAVKQPAANDRLDLHDALLSGELYEDLGAEEEETEASAPQIAENDADETERASQPSQPSEMIVTAPEALQMLPDPRAEARVAEVTALPFESMDEPPVVPEPRIRSVQRKLRAQPVRQRETMVHQDRTSPNPCQSRGSANRRATCS